MSCWIRSFSPSSEMSYVVLALYHGATGGSNGRVTPYNSFALIQAKRSLLTSDKESPMVIA